VVTLEGVLGKDDSREMVGYFVNALCASPGGNDYLEGFARRHSRYVLAAGGQPRTVLKVGRPARDALERLLAKDLKALGELIGGLKVLSALGTTAGEGSGAPLAAESLEDDAPAEDAAPESQGPVPSFFALVVASETPEEGAFAQAATEALEELRALDLANCAEAAADGIVSTEFDALAKKVAALEDDLKRANKAYGQLDDVLHEKVEAERRLSQTVTRLKRQVADAVAARDQSVTECAAIRADRDTLASNMKKSGLSLDGRLTQLQGEKTKMETALFASHREVEMREAALGRANDMVDALEEDKRRLEARLADAAKEREELVSLGDIFADADPEQSLTQLATAMDTLGSLKAIVSRSVEAQRRIEDEAEAARREVEAELERIAAAQRRVTETDEAWARRQSERIAADIARGEQALFVDGVPQHLLIDGHNLILRRYEPQMERTTRAWLERMVCVMNQHYELDIRLVFDAPIQFASNEETICSGVRRYYHSDSEGGADARIASLLREFSPEDLTLVASSDHRHIWADAEEARREGYNVSLVTAETLHNYLIALDDRQMELAEAVGP